MFCTAITLNGKRHLVETLEEVSAPRLLVLHYKSCYAGHALIRDKAEGTQSSDAPGGEFQAENWDGGNVGGPPLAAFIKERRLINLVGAEVR